MEKIYDEQPLSIEPVFNAHGALTSFFIRENISTVEVPAAETATDGAETSVRQAWRADEMCVCGLEIYDYDLKVAAIIRAKYSAAAELAIQRQRESKPEEFSAYFDFCEAAKAAVK